MKNKKRIWPYSLIIAGSVLVLTNTCTTKDDSNGNNDEIIDIDGNVYTSVTIGSQVWMVENLKTTRLNDGTPIPHVIGENEWVNQTTYGYCWVNNQYSNKDSYGALYNEYAVFTGKLCPTGWHVPTDNEWHTLVLYVDPNATLGINEERAESYTAGNKLKESGTSHWLDPNTAVTNEIGFSALPGGLRFGLPGYGFSAFRVEGNWWTSTTSGSNEAWHRSMVNSSGSVTRTHSSFKNIGASIRCLKD